MCLYNLSEFKKFLKIFGLKITVIKLWNKICPIQLIWDMKLRDLNSKKKLMKKLRRYLKKGDQHTSEHSDSKIIWWLWYQGLEDAPPIVKKCWESVNNYKGEYELITLDNKNLYEYVNLPATILEKRKKGIIGDAHFSDLCRLSLLKNYGGVWIDATVLMTGEIPEFIKKQNLFFFQSSNIDQNFSCMSNWFIKAQSNNYFIDALYRSIIEYWEKNSHVLDYYIFHMFAKLLVEQDAVCQSMLTNMAYLSNAQPHVLQNLLKEKFSISQWESVLFCSFVHKLTYRVLSQDSGTFYDKVLKLEFRNGEK